RSGVGMSRGDKRSLNRGGVMPCNFKNNSRVLCASVVATIMAFTSVVALGQSLNTASIRGRVLDPSGAAVAGATVTATSPALLVSQLTTQSDADGESKFTELPIGTYKVSYQASGFQQIIRENILLTAGFTATVDVPLKVGNVNESVTVEAESPIVDTEHTT